MMRRNRKKFVKLMDQKGVGNKFSGSGELKRSGKNGKVTMTAQQKCICVFKNGFLA